MIVLVPAGRHIVPAGMVSAVSINVASSSNSKTRLLEKGICISYIRK